MDFPLQGFLHSSLSNAPRQMAGAFQFVQEQHDPILAPFPPTLAPFPPTLDTVSYFRMDYPDLTTLSNSYADLMETQRRELEQYLKLQNDWLRANLLQQSKQHMLSLMSDFESKASFLLIQKDEELRRARDQVSTLGGCLKREMEEKEMWKRIASEKEALAVSTSNAMEKMRNLKAEIEDVGSSINVPQGEKGKQSEGARWGLIPCKACGTGFSCMLLLPCRHLCACKHCVAFIDACPVCHLGKTDSIEISLD